jgi:putative protease
MSIKLLKTELLAPAGGWPQLRAAVDAGADAVFLGAGSFNMRAGAKNFSLEELADVSSYCHSHKVKAYLTLNTQVYEHELADLETVVIEAASAKIDAVIAADLAVVAAAQRQHLPVHISTQLSVSNSASLKWLYDLGIRRVVLARECTLEDLLSIRQIIEAQMSDMQIEVFGHGAMCVAVSGRCFMSGFENGRSANRGECSQPCRREYKITSERGGEGFTLSGQHILSPKDLCILPFIEQLLDLGVASIKLEGRSRSPDYVHTVVNVYRKALDFYRDHRGDEDFVTQFEALKTMGMEQVQRVYNRGFSKGFYMGKPSGDWTSLRGNQSSHKREYIGQVLQVDPDGTRATVRLESSGIRKEEGLFGESPELGYLSFLVEEVTLNDMAVSEASKGSTIQLKSVSDMHKGLRIYRLTDR